MKTLQQLMSIIRSDDPDRFYRTTEWKHKRREILNRDHHECKRCLGQWKSDPPIKRYKLSFAKYVHHIEPLLKRPDLCMDDDNLVSLCFNCHEAIEKRGFCKERKEPLTPERW